MIGRHASVFVDTSAWFAFADLGDSRHAAAEAVFTQVARDRTLIYTSNIVLAGTHALTLNRLGRVYALRVIGGIRSGSVALIRVTDADEEHAIAIIDQFVDKAFSYTDATSFAVMRRVGAQAAFSFDRHFAQFGLMTVGLDP